MKLLLDTNAYSAWKRGHAQTCDLVRGAEHLVMSVVVVGELLHGFRGGTRFAENRRELDALLDRPVVTLLTVTLTTAEHFARVATDLRRQGTPIPTNDIWIAAHAMESGAELASFDGHFESVPGLSWIHVT